MKSPGREIDVNGILGHIYEICFHFFNPFCPILVLKLAKSANIGEKRIFSKI
jgi:hypothetical protein